MTFLPVVERELRVASRRLGTYANRFLAALIGIIIFAFIFLGFKTSPPREVGESLFYTLSGILMAVSLLSGVRYTADCLSEEKREGTLGLLFLTDLKGYDVVFGKLAATSLNVFYGMLAIFPVLAVPLLIGGVSKELFGRMVLVLTVTLLFSLAAGIFVSAHSRSARKAMSATFLLILLVQAGLPALGAWFAFQHRIGAPDSMFLLPSAGYAFALAIRPAIQPGGFLASVGVIHGLTWILLILASISVRYSWQDKSAGAGRTTWRLRFRDWFHGGAIVRHAWRTRLLNINPCLWLGCRSRWKPALTWMGLAALATLWLAGLVEWGNDWMETPVCMFTLFFVHLIFKFWIASEASQRFGPDRRSGALELVLSTPVTVKEMVHGQMLALRRQFLWPILVVVVVDVFFTFHILSRESETGVLLWTCAVGMVTFLADCYALGWLGMWIGLVAKHPNRAAGTAVSGVLGLFWVAFLGCMFLISILGLERTLMKDGGSFIALYLLLGLGIDAAFVVWARFRLLGSLRAVATQRFEPPRPWLSFLRRAHPAARPAPPAMPASN